MKQLTIYRQYFTNADCYKAGVVQTPKGIQVHSTGANNPYLKRYVQPDDGRLGQNKYNNSHNRSGLNVCANAYIGKLDDGTPAIYQTLPWDYRCWLSGSSTKGNANKLGYIGYEMCEDNLGDKNYFEAVVMGLSVLLDAYLCKKYNIPVDMIHDHNELHDMGLASNHGDIKHWLKKYDLTMNDYRDAVSAAIKEGVEVTYIEGDQTWTETYPGEGEEPTMLYEAIVTAEKGSTVNLRQNPSMNATVLAKIPLKTIVEVLEEIDNEWAKIKYNDIIGYMMRQFLVKDEPQPEPEPEPIDTIEVPRDQLQALRDQLAAALVLIDSLLSNT